MWPKNGGEIKTIPNLSRCQLNKKNEGRRNYSAGLRFIIELLLRRSPEKGSFYMDVAGKRTKELIGLISLDPHHDGIY